MTQMAKFLTKLATTAAFLVAGATAANAGAITFTSVGNDTNKKAGEDWVAKFDSPLLAGYTLSLRMPASIRALPPLPRHRMATTPNISRSWAAAAPP